MHTHTKHWQQLEHISLLEISWTFVYISVQEAVCARPVLANEEQPKCAMVLGSVIQTTWPQGRLKYIPKDI